MKMTDTQLKKLRKDEIIHKVNDLTDTINSYKEQRFYLMLYGIIIGMLIGYSL